MLRLCLIGLLLLLGVALTGAQEALPSATVPPRPAPLQTLPGEGFALELYFATLRQGEAGLMRLVGEGISEARALFRSRDYPFYQREGDGWYGFLVADVDAIGRSYPLSVLLAYTDGSTRTLEASITVESAGYPRQDFTVPSDRAYLISPEIERQEYARLDALMAVRAPNLLWDVAGFALPTNTPLSAAFGTYRILNQAVQTRHTGVDQSAPVGSPVAAMAAGQVTFAGTLDIRGNYILIHHGWGVYSGYAHLSQSNVATGDAVAAGQIIGLSGNTGRSSGPHLHWEVAVQGAWVNGERFLALWLPR